MIDHLRANAIEGAWPTAERLLVCVGADASSEAVLRAGSRLAKGLNAPWTAVTLERLGRESLDEASLRRIDEALALAERLGADTVRLAGRDLVTEIIGYARRNNFTQVVIGRSAPGSGRAFAVTAFLACWCGTRSTSRSMSWWARRTAGRRAVAPRGGA